MSGTAKTINDYPAATGIDAVNDQLLIEQSGVYNKINRNTLLGVSGTPADLSSSQIVTNKTIGGTNNITQNDGTFTLQNTSDTTKRAKFSLSGITTGNTRTYTLPDTSDTVATLGATQTLTNKTLTSPTINSPTITNATISADALTGYTSSSTGTIYGMSISGGTIGSSAYAPGSISSTAIATNGVAASNLATSAIKLGYAQITSNQTTTSTAFTPVTGMSAAVTVPSGGRDVKITIELIIQTTGGPAAWGIALYKDGAFLRQWYRNEESPNYNFPFTGICRDPAPSAGSHTYAVYFVSDNASNTVTIEAGTGASTVFSSPPAFILVEAI